ncbi:hypothetical protein SBRCBS47491_010206 [Sporothrix bragantina]|uniref:FAD-binding domain-containing protein n=1 Tax=Sporothrix bragantina TaxID=671064 RepID=A0ABP0D0I1_9PEZI
MAPPEEFSRPPTKDFNVAVVGGGIAGLTVTLQLLQQGVRTTLYEQARQFGEIGAGVSFGPNALRAMSLISPHVRNAFEAQATFNQSEANKGVWFDFRYGESCDGKHTAGDLIYRSECDGGQTSIKRADFLDELVKLLPDGIAQFRKRCVDYDKDGKCVLLRFEDGTTARHDAVIACDGIKSRLRRVLLGNNDPAAKAVFSGKCAYRGLIPMEDVKALLGDELAGNSQMYLGRRGHILTFSVAKGKFMNVVAMRARDEWTSDEWVVSVDKEEMQAEFDGWSDQARQIIRMVQTPDIWALFDHPPSHTYFSGRVCLLGDAAHASTPHKGSGAGMAIEDAYIMGNLLGSIQSANQIEQAFSVFNSLRKERSQRLVTDSRETGQVYQLEMSDDPAWIADFISKRMGWVWNHDLEEELETGREMLRTKGEQKRDT